MGSSLSGLLHHHGTSPQRKGAKLALCGNYVHRIGRAYVVTGRRLCGGAADEFQFYDCAYEVLLQSLGFINDDSSVPWTMFNDNVQMGFFDVYDQYLVNSLYDPRIRPGMTKGEVDALPPDIFPTVRTWVAQVNSAKRRKLARWFER
jgi:hypothetical protein